MTLLAGARSRRPLQIGRRTACAPRPRAPPPRALFGVFAPSKPKANANVAQDLVNELLQSVEGTDGGLKASQARREQIAQLVDELEGCCPRNPLRSPLLFGEYEVLYASKPQTAGGPFRSPIGRAVFPGQRAVQLIEPPNIIVNEVSYRTLGLLPGSARQEGEFTALSSDTLLIKFPDLDGKAKGGPPQRKIKISYLDDSIRVARALPANDDEEGSFYVFRRVKDEVEEAPTPRAALGTKRLKAAASDAQAEPGAGRSALGTRLLGRRDGLATIAEKRYAQQKSGSRGTGTASRGTGTSGTGRKTREELAAERAAARAAAEEERRAAREAAAAEKAAAEEERRARQAQLAAERARLAEVKEAARQRLADLQAEALEAAEEATTAAVAARDADKAAASLIQQAKQARGAIEQAASDAAAALQEVDRLKLAEKEASAAVADARGALKQLQAGRR